MWSVNAISMDPEAPLGILTPSHYQVVGPNALGSRSGMVWPEVTSFPGCFSYGVGMRLGHLGLSHACETDYGSYRVMAHAYIQQLQG